MLDPWAPLTPDPVLGALDPRLKGRQTISGYLLPMGPLVRERNAC